MGIKLAYGLRGGHVVHISEIKPDEKGEKCNCSCPLCGSILVARLGEERKRHFAHKASCNCDTAYAQQTGLHLLAKEVIKENSQILVPGLTISRYEIASGADDVFVAAEVDIDLPNIAALSVKYDAVEIEKPIDDIVADAVIRVGGKPLIVEVAVTHFVDEIKTKKFNALGLPAFEIDLSGLLENPQSRDAIVAAVLSDESNRQWVFNPKRERLLEEKRAEFQKGYEEKRAEYQKKYDAEVRKRELEEKRKEEYRQSNLHVLQELMDPHNYANELNRLRDDRTAARWLKRFVFSKGLSEYPFYMDIPITGEWVFTCDRRIWQGKLFEDYVYRGFDHDLCIFNTSQIRKRIFKDHLIIHYDKQKTYRTTVIINGQEHEISLSYDVVQRYFEYLDLLGFVTRNGYEWISERPASLEPPNYLASVVLKEVLNSVDRTSPDIDQVMKDELLSRLDENDRNTVLEWYKRKRESDHI